MLVDSHILIDGIRLKTVFAPETPEFLVRQRELNSKPLEQHPVRKFLILDFEYPSLC
jgi:hypothetical protein